jgi:MFS family permease
MEGDLHADISGLGVIAGSFYLGVGLMQVPAGVLAARIGPRRVFLIGIALSSAAIFCTSVASDILQVSVFRFIVGWGMAFTFAPGLVLIARFLGRGKSGLGVGLFNSAFYAGGLIGFFGWTILASVVTWRPSVALGGGLEMTTGVLILFFIPRDTGNGGFRVQTSILWQTLKERQLILLGLGTLGLSTGNTLVSSFMTYYLVESYHTSLTLAGLIASLLVVVPVFSSLWGGGLYDRVRMPKRLMMFSVLTMVMALMVCSITSLFAAVVSTLLAGIAAGIGFTVTFAAAKDINSAGSEYDSLAVAWINGIAFLGSFWPPLIFSYLATNSGYSMAWLGGAALGLVWLIPLILLTERRVDGSKGQYPIPPVVP